MHVIGKPACRLDHSHGPCAGVATVFCDCSIKHLTTHLTGDALVQADELSQDIRLESFRTIPRLGIEHG